MKTQRRIGREIERLAYRQMEHRNRYKSISNNDQKWAAFPESRSNSLDLRYQTVHIMLQPETAIVICLPSLFWTSPSYGRVLLSVSMRLFFFLRCLLSLLLMKSLRQSHNKYWCCRIFFWAFEFLGLTSESLDIDVWDSLFIILIRVLTSEAIDIDVWDSPFIILIRVLTSLDIDVRPSLAHLN